MKKLMFPQICHSHSHPTADVPVTYQKSFFSVFHPNKTSKFRNILFGDGSVRFGGEGCGQKA